MFRALMGRQLPGHRQVQQAKVRSRGCHFGLSLDQETDLVWVVMRKEPHATTTQERNHFCSNSWRLEMVCLHLPPKYWPPRMGGSGAVKDAEGRAAAIQVFVLFFPLEKNTTTLSPSKGEQNPGLHG